MDQRGGTMAGIGSVLDRRAQMPAWDMSLGRDALIGRIATQAIQGHSPLIDGADDELLAAAARRLGDLWLEDSCSFCDVTLGVHRLSRSHAAREAATLLEIDRTRCAPTILLSAAPGDQHGFGITLVASALARHGWLVTADVPPVGDALLAAVRREHFDFVGLSIGHERAMERTPGLIGALRRASRNRQVAIALGGPMLNGRAAIARGLGADLHADDAATLDAVCRNGMRIAA